MTCWNSISFDVRLSERKKPFGSDALVDNRQNSRSVRRAGSVDSAPAAGSTRSSTYTSAAGSAPRTNNRGVIALMPGIGVDAIRKPWGQGAQGLRASANVSEQRAAG